MLYKIGNIKYMQYSHLIELSNWNDGYVVLYICTWTIYLDYYVKYTKYIWHFL